MKRLLHLGFIAILLAFTALAVPTTNKSTAHAATVTPHTDTSHCASLGSLIETDTMESDGIILGYVNVYYNSSNGYNCAETVSSSTTNGQKKDMEVSLSVCAETHPSSACTPISNNKPYNDYDFGNYYHYAGPVGVYGAGHCITIFGEINWNGHGYYYGPGNAVHCD